MAINFKRAAKKQSWRERLHNEYNEWARAHELAAQVTPVTEDEKDELAQIIDSLNRYDSACPMCRSGLFHGDDAHLYYAYGG